ncbi:MAG: hypothetical protein NC079_06415 [Clostridium sp.]|nr:hypothetical protein [Acetatifactor muris]MCM1526408.1 hypothetical protein [Bacteroides sp.]MCM1563229.1 hypothetical protein [Clostridium sp.]
MKDKSVLRENIPISLFCLLCIPVFTALFGFSMLLSWVNVEFWNEFVYMRQDSVVGNLLWMGIALLFLAAVVKLCEIAGKRCRTDWVALAVSIVCALISIWWVYTSGTVPQGDQANICNYAMDLDNGDISCLQQGAYVANCRQQLGLITFVRILHKIAGGDNYYEGFQYFSALMVFVMVFSGYQIVKRITRDDRKTEIIYLLFMLFCVPMYGYAPFVYGEVCSTAAVFLGAWLLLSCMENFHWWKLAALAGVCGFALQTRLNSLVPLIGFLIVVLVKMIAKPCRQTAAAGIAILAGLLLSQAAITGMYARYIPEDSKPIPSILYIVMGTHDQIQGAPGWYDAYNVELYREMNWDPDAAGAAASKDLAAFAQKCVRDPGYALDFYTEKMNVQWNAPMYQCIVANNAFGKDWTPLIESVYEGQIGIFLEKFMNIGQLLLYGGVLFLLLAWRDRWDRIENYVLLIGVYGGFLFSLLWEAKPRYVFPYMLLMIPYAAAGIARLLKLVRALISRAFHAPVFRK